VVVTYWNKEKDRRMRTLLNYQTYSAEIFQKCLFSNPHVHLGAFDEIFETVVFCILSKSPDSTLLGSTLSFANLLCSFYLPRIFGVRNSHNFLSTFTIAAVIITSGCQT